MSYTTTPAYIQHTKGWGPRIKEHPALSWMTAYGQAFDSGTLQNGPHTPWHADDFTYTKPTGETISGGAAAWSAVCEMFAPLTTHNLEPFFFVAWETDSGYELLGLARFFANLPVPGDREKVDFEGRRWDVEGPAASYFVLVRDPDGPQGLKLKAQRLFADGMPMVGEMVKRGMITPEQLLAKAS